MASSATMAAVLRRIFVTVVIGLTGVVLAPSPAGAHGIEGVEATNYRTRITSVEPEMETLTVRVVEVGSRLELINRTGERVIVRGYQEEPYLRIDPEGGVFINERSPATYLNADREGSLQPPPDADPSAEPEWERIDDGVVARWHDHRAHWMGTRDPPPVRDAPGETHVVIPEWEITVDVDGEEVIVTGDLTWIPGPSAAPWLALSAVLALAVAAAAFTQRARPLLATTVGVLVLVDMVHVGGEAASGAGGFAAGLGAVLSGSYFSLAAWAAGGLAIRMLLRGSADGTFAAGLAGAIIALFGGVADAADLTRSQVPFGLGDVAARLLVSLSLGLGLGLVIAAVIRLRRDPAPKSTQSTIGDGGEGREPTPPQVLERPALE